VGAGIRPAQAIGNHFPGCGFTQRSCVAASIKQKGYPAGAPVPDRCRLRPAPAVVRAHHRKLKSNATLRDNNFVAGNAFNGWHVDVTGRTRSHGHWVEVYVPNAKRWVYLEASSLSWPGPGPSTCLRRSTAFALRDHAHATVRPGTQEAPSC
jgi:hypothetical protein